MPSPEIAKTTEKTFDAVELTRQLRSEVHGETEHLGRAELKEYLHTRVKMPRTAYPTIPPTDFKTTEFKNRK